MRKLMMVVAMAFLVITMGCDGASNPIFDCDGLNCSGQNGAASLEGRDLAQEDENPDPVEKISFARIYNEVIAQSCTGCHGQAGNLSLNGEQNAYEVLTEQYSNQRPQVRYVTAGDDDLESNYLLAKMVSDGRYRAGSQMPPYGELSAEKIELVRKWIAQGALR